jgi:hypothetical protein
MLVWKRFAKPVLKLFRHYLPFFLSFGLVFFLTIFFRFNPEFTSSIHQKAAFLPFLKQQKELAPISPDIFDFGDQLEESENSEASQSRNWWLNSGGLVFNENGIIKTIQGSLNPENNWFKAYLRSTPVDTDGGSHPQNIFRLVNKNNLQNIRQEAYFKINKTVLSNSPNRNESNGFLFFNRYIDGDNLYYTGIRVDGTSIIKKKKNGKYYTLDQKPLYDGNYEKSSKPNLLPENQWIGIRSEVKNLNFREVSLTVFIDKNADGNWEQIAEALDDGVTFDGSAFINAGFPGIRTDFMDIEFKNYKIDLIN